MPTPIHPPDVVMHRQLEGMHEQARRALVRAKGGACAAWLVGSQRRKIHRDGGIQLTLDPGQRMPFWCWLAFEYLRGRPKWRVDTLPERDGKRIYRVWWMQWHREGPWRISEQERRRRARNARKWHRRHLGVAT